METAITKDELRDIAEKSNNPVIKDLAKQKLSDEFQGGARESLSIFFLAIACLHRSFFLFECFFQSFL